MSSLEGQLLVASGIHKFAVGGQSCGDTSLRLGKAVTAQQLGPNPTYQPPSTCATTHYLPMIFRRPQNITCTWVDDYPRRLKREVHVQGSGINGQGRHMNSVKPPPQHWLTSILLRTTMSLYFPDPTYSPYLPLLDALLARAQKSIYSGLLWWKVLYIYV